MSEIRADKIHNVTGDNDSGIDLSTNDQIILKTADTTALTISSSQVATFANLPSGDNGDVLLSTITASSDDEIDFTGLFSSTYANYKIIAHNVHVSSDNTHIGLRYFIGGSIKSDSQYRGTRIRLHSGSSAAAADMVIGAVEQSDTEFAMFGGESTGNATGENVNFHIIIYNPLATDNFKFIQSHQVGVDLSGDAQQIHYGGYYKNGQAALTGVRIFTNTGNFASGTFRFFGMK